MESLSCSSGGMVFGEARDDKSPTRQDKRINRRNGTANAKNSDICSAKEGGEKKTPPKSQGRQIEEYLIQPTPASARTTITLRGARLAASPHLPKSLPFLFPFLRWDSTPFRGFLFLCYFHLHLLLSDPTIRSIPPPSEDWGEAMGKILAASPAEGFVSFRSPSRASCRDARVVTA
ncbi:hypothetical protein BHM03_00004956 [Ensete ventricosum]|nr:hypothetical protein BHM03_00004956 [Ensete ventricosum]